MKLSSSWLRAVCCILLANCVVACQKERWEVGKNVRARDVEVAAALGDTNQASSADLAATDIPAIPYPQALRPCCAFGMDLKVALGQVPVPGVEIGNLVGPHDVGAHRYNNGYLSLHGKDPRGIVDNEVREANAETFGPGADAP